jgi:hypothetical protein
MVSSYLVRIRKISLNPSNLRSATVPASESSVDNGIDDNALLCPVSIKVVQEEISSRTLAHCPGQVISVKRLFCLNIY